jgi:sulfite reductase (NADPH) flavoprotein alpha-component
VLALSSALFLVVASITGVILAIAPISQSVQSYAVRDLDQVSVAQSIAALEKEYDEVFEVSITADDFVIASVITEDGNLASLYVDPITGASLGQVQERAPLFNWVTNLHRSLFLKGVGRFFVGLVSFLLCLISITGFLLLIKRQGGFLKLYGSIKEKDIAQRTHIILGRWLLIPLLLLAGTGVYLSAEKFELLPDTKVTHLQIDAILPNAEAVAQPIALFEELSLNDLRTLIFPFSEAAEDYFELALKDKEVRVHQYTGEVLSEAPYPFTLLASRWSLQWHTGQGSVLWAVILLLASASILVFIYSGFSMTLKRRKKTHTKLVNADKDESEFIILVGSESGNVYAFAKAFHDAVTESGRKAFLAPLNTYTTYKKATKLIVFTATYGDGEAPTNARNFEAIFKNTKPVKDLWFAVVGFGSKEYTHYCRFAITVDALLQSHSSFKPLHPLVKINEQSEIALKKWLYEWNELTKMSLKIVQTKKKVRSEQLFEVVERSLINIDNTSLLRLRGVGKTTFQSGDLLDVIPPGEQRVRQYSIAKIDDDILLSIKWHPKGGCSTYLTALKVGDSVTASITKNTSFHVPNHVSSVWFIGNGTGIAPYLGMLSESTTMEKRMLWGGRTATSFDLYRGFVEEALSRKQLLKYELALSQEKEKSYVQDVLSKRQMEVAQNLKEGGVFMLCGSMEMQQGVLEILEEITKTHLQQPLSAFENNGQLLMDCY